MTHCRRNTRSTVLRSAFLTNAVSRVQVVQLQSGGDVFEEQAGDDRNREAKEIDEL